MNISVIVPAYNEEKLLPATVECIRAALNACGVDSEVIVVDNESDDRTAEIAEAAGARVVDEGIRNISRVRNTGAAAAIGDVLIFIDADTHVPETLFRKIANEMRDPRCFGGAVAVEYGRFERWWMRFYSMGWGFWGKVFNMKQGAAQFCRKTVFDKLGGYDERIFLGEDIDFYWRLTALAKREGGRLIFIEQPKVETSTRRFDKMSIWKTLLLINPLYILLNSRRASSWKDWYENAVR
jgi:cellulose synthase/poly-beta-1,6-N-acetylglucosamine synthase-like glycosyltransferase